MTDREAALWARRFWQLVGRTEPFPRSLETAVAWALPLAIVKLPRLGLPELRGWLLQRNIRLNLEGSNRALRACLLARAGRGVILVEGSDPDEERRYSLAHETAHFLVDYLDPRQRALQALGEAAQDAIDGLRPPTPQERFTGLLHGVDVGVYAHLMERTIEGDVDRLEILAAEDRADRLALELLAPRQTVVQLLEQNQIRWREQSAAKETTEVLVDQFGLPPAIAREYGRFLVIGRRSAQSFREWLGT